MVQKLEDLITNLEAATEGNSELNRAIDLLLNSGAYVWSPEWYSGPPNDYLRWPDPSPGVAKYRNIHRYTISVDMALTIVPKGWTVARINQNDDRTWACELRRGYLTSYTAVVFGGKYHKDPTAALAVCKAAINARRYEAEVG